jgi:hypothetical protein
MILPFSHRTVGAVASAALLSAVLVGAPSLTFAQSGTTAPGGMAPSAAPAPAAAPAPNAHLERTAKHTAPAAVEKRITDLHRRLKITADQESDWNAVAQAMRDSAEKMNDLVQQRQQEMTSENAVQDLQSYEQIAEAHVDGLKTLVPAFQTLYGKMSPAQQKSADAIFSGNAGKRASKMKKSG